MTVRREFRIKRAKVSPTAKQISTVKKLYYEGCFCKGKSSGRRSTTVRSAASPAKSQGSQSTVRLAASGMYQTAAWEILQNGLLSGLTE
jgi:hypothetical protein